MKEILIFPPIVILYLTLKTTLFISVPLPDVTLLIVFYMGFRRPSAEGAVMSFALGFLEDALTGGIFGITSFSLVSIFLMVHIVSGKVEFSTPLPRAGSAAVLSLVKWLLGYAALRLSGVSIPFTGKAALQIIATGALAPVAITLLLRLSAYLSPRTFERGE
ncbi:MAG: rod shape-determining protein MreD [Deltaproteobacteria bacterium]|nr:rod shape-determining protein MreD [Deltaproteobacteria bacterium]